MPHLQDRVVLVTAAAQGIGRAIAQGFLGAGGAAFTTGAIHVIDGGWSM